VSNDGVTQVACSWTDGSTITGSIVNVRKDSAPPGVSASADRGPDNNGWYNHAVRVSFSGDDGASGVASCTSATYSGPDAGEADVGGSCTDHAGNVGRASLRLKYDSTPPSVEARPDRAPDSNGWYKRPVTVAFAGADPLSGVDSCSQPVVYQGPDSASASVAGSCQDKAGNRSQPSGLALKFDATPPRLTRLSARATSRGIVLTWAASQDAVSFRVERRPGLRERRPSMIYNGKARTYVDTRPQTGIRYRYTVTALDLATNAATIARVARTTQTVSRPTRATPGRSTPTRATPALLGPRAGARLGSPPTLRWSAVPRATYYNVQLFRNGRKVLSAWPTRPRLQLAQTWRFEGRPYRLTPGTYRWYVWPGFGARSQSTYGKLVGTQRFTVLRT
jgi:hypothetical protein